MLLSVAAALVTMALKAGAWWLTGSVGLLSDALESTVNLGAALVGFSMLRLALQHVLQWRLWRVPRWVL